MKIFYKLKVIAGELVSLGMIADDGRQYYAANADMDQGKVLSDGSFSSGDLSGIPHAPGKARLDNPLGLNKDHPSVLALSAIRDEVASFFLATPDPELWSWFGAESYVALVKLCGESADLPRWSGEIQQEIWRSNRPDLRLRRVEHFDAFVDAMNFKETFYLIHGDAE